ncbi:MAG: FprA family A-type flavoprotein [Dysgonamonadaceae bacterium]|jgi:flavorubredoxin|nr:FprA family A-type flavoprotein [Dysgonamonadaceae bacterium]
MYKSFNISDNIFYVGVNDRSKQLFENIWPLPKGVSYNSYLIRDEKVALIDAVDICYSELFFNKVDAVLGKTPIDYLIINHMEPDHSGAIAWLVNRYPDIQIVGNNRSADMLKGFYNISDNVLIIKDKESLSLGKCNLQFFLTPMVHWPETMMTYAQEYKTIFTGDAFGSFGTLDGAVLDWQTVPEKYEDEMIRYYSNIVGKYGSQVQVALKKLADVEIETICSTHGPVWTKNENLDKVVALYDKLSRYDSDKGLVIAYGSMYGNVEQVAEVIAAEAAANGIKHIVLHNVSKSHNSEILRDIFKYRGLLIGSPTYNNKLYPGVESLLSAIQNRAMKNRYFGYFGGFTWAGAAVKHLKEFAENSGFEIVEPSVEIKQSLNESTFESAVALGRNMAEKLNNL